MLDSATSFRTRLAELSDWLDGLSERGVFLVVLAPLLTLYLATATWTYPLANDSYTNSAAAWSIGTNGTVFLDGYEIHADYYAWFGWFVPARDTVVSKYPPGAALFAAPFYSVWPDEATAWTYPPDQIPEDRRLPNQTAATFPIHPSAPAAAAAALATALAIALLALAFMYVGGSPSMAVAGAYVAGLGTSAWPVAADQLWQHGPAMFWVALGLVLAQRRPLGSGLAFGMAILTRPPLALIAAATGLWLAFRTRIIKPMVLIGVGSATGLLLYVVYNAWVFGEPSVAGGYEGTFEDNVFGFRIGFYFRTLVEALLAQDVGLLVWSPFLVVLAFGLRAGWRAAPAWAQGAALGGLLYLLLQYKANRASGGTFLGYRYPLEALTAAGPVLFLAYKEKVAAWPRLRKVFFASAAVAILLQGLASVGIEVI